MLSLFKIGHTFSQSPQSIHFSISTSGYQKPSLSVLYEIACLGQTSPQALQPQQSTLFWMLIISIFGCKNGRHRGLLNRSYESIPMGIPAPYSNCFFYQYNSTLMSKGVSKSFRRACFVSFSLSRALSVGIFQSISSEVSRIEIPPSASG